MIERWHDMGYKVAVLVNPPFTHSDLPEADRVIVQEAWLGFPIAVNILCREVPGDVVAVVGDDVLPDPRRKAPEIRKLFLDSFPDTFGVIQPSGDVYGLSDICAVSPWIGRKFIEESYGGRGPYHEGYFHYFSDHELQVVAEMMKVFKQWPDVVQFHDHWQRRKERRPAHLLPAKSLHGTDAKLFDSRKLKGFPMASDRDTPIQSHAKAWREHYLKGPGELETVNGYGSYLDNTQEIRQALPLIFKEHDVFTFTDVPCGDFNWMGHVDLSGIDYLGCDVVPEMVESNRKEYPETRFQVLNLIQEVPRKSDLILCRDFLFHLPNEWVKQVLSNIKASGSRLLLTTYFNGVENQDLGTNGNIGWRKLNLRRPPYRFPRPLRWIQENDSHACQGRGLGLWRIEDIT